jgi:hypothetical protein
MRYPLRILATSLVLVVPAHGPQVATTFRPRVAQTGHIAQIAMGG